MNMFTGWDRDVETINEMPVIVLQPNIVILSSRTPDLAYIK